MSDILNTVPNCTPPTGPRLACFDLVRYSRIQNTTLEANLSFIPILDIFSG